MAQCHSICNWTRRQALSGPKMTPAAKLFKWESNTMALLETNLLSDHLDPGSTLWAQYVTVTVASG